MLNQPKTFSQTKVISQSKRQRQIRLIISTILSTIGLIAIAILLYLINTL